MPGPPDDLDSQLQDYGQEHLFRFWKQLGSAEQQQLAAQVRDSVVPRLAAIAGQLASHARRMPADEPTAGLRLPEVVTLAERADDIEATAQARRRGHQLLRGGGVAVLQFAGGRGSRLGFAQAKGMFEIGPVSRRSLYQILAEQILARSRQAGKSVPLRIMTSSLTHNETTRFFAEHDNFGLPERDVGFFQQGDMPAVDMATGRVLLESTSRVALAPNGNGGLFEALRRNKILDQLPPRVEHFFLHNVDNPTIVVCDPEFIGRHVLANAEVSTKVARRKPGEKMGVVLVKNGCTQVIEYGELPQGESEQFWTGNTGIHVISRSFLQRMVDEQDGPLPWHLSQKKVAHVDQHGTFVTPEQPNAYLFEQFWFDVMPWAERTLVVETNREAEFNPVKNQNLEPAGSPPTRHSPEAVRAAMNKLHADWLINAGQKVAAGAEVEIGATFALDGEAVAERLAGQQRVFRNRVFLS